jgi:hypothetical protein
MKNLVLSQLSQDDFKRLEPCLHITPFKQHSVVFEAEQQIEHVYVPMGAVVSLVVTLRSGKMVELRLPPITRPRRRRGRGQILKSQS